MSRYTREIRWRFNSPAAKRYIDRGRKLVGEMVERLTLGKLQHGARTIRLDDGTVLKAWMDGSIPIVEIVAHGGAPAMQDYEDCELYMESGQLALGPTVASLSDSGVAPTIAHNTRTAWDAKFNGAIKVVRVGSSFSVKAGAPLPNDGTSHACDEVRDVDDNVIVTVAAKKTAQFLIPASCFTGLMRRWVQAQYGSAGAVYGTVSGTRYPTTSWTLPASSTPKLQVQTAQKDEDGNLVYQSMNLDFRSYHCCGIVDPTGQLSFWFASIWPYSAHGGQKIEFRKANLTDCGKLLRYYLLAIGRAHPDYQQLSTFLLSQLTPEYDIAVERALPSEIVPAMGPYGWKFNGSGSAASLVAVEREAPVDVTVNGYTTYGLVRNGEYTVHTLTFTTNVGDGLPDFELSSSAPVTGWVDTFYSVPTILMPTHSFKRLGVSQSTSYNQVRFDYSPSNDWSKPFDSAGTLTPVYDYDAPMYCWYEGDTLVLVRHEFASVAAPTDLTDSACATYPRSQVTWLNAGDDGECPCDVDCWTGLVCDSTSGKWKRQVRAGFYTAYFSNVALSFTYPPYDVDYENDGVTGLGDARRSSSASSVAYEADVITEVTETCATCCGGTTRSTISCGNPTGGTHTCSTTFDRYECVDYTDPDPSACTNGGTSTVTSYKRRGTNKATNATEGDNARSSVLQIPQFDASSAFLRTFTTGYGTGANTAWTATFDKPYKIEGTYTGDAYVVEVDSTPCAGIPANMHRFEVYVTDCAWTGVTQFCENDSPDYGNSTFRYDNNVVSSTADYTWWHERMQTTLLARGTATVVDDLSASSSTTTGTPVHPACYVFWDYQAQTITSPTRITYATASNNYGAVTWSAAVTSAWGAYAKVWQSDGGDIARQTTLRRIAELEPLAQFSGYPPRADELFSFIGWA